ncbi:VOC family protein [Tessaracoccus sp. ZS01]|uniref:VOC family protein n=1 Tax=Tessaracoccus sp. ZS01 TaxID=1906324 RepID=UPI00096F5281|nr:VOC family protein [Tessaracoccus sp. ZS01]MCG6566035.1 glyoxalase-like domain protein [Tessaracoccus sp. ZS01]OMG58546.1 glyoxalase-like domain protein [Tessaracoccus sp. ZS01]
MPKPYGIQICVDTRDAHNLADWWAESLGWTVEPSDPVFIQRMIDGGYATEADTQTHRGNLVWRGAAAICPPDEVGSPGRRRILFQDVPEEKQTKNRLHYDVHSGGDDIDALRDEFLARGASYVDSHNQGTHRWHVMLDPEGNEFCVS